MILSILSSTHCIFIVVEYLANEPPKQLAL